MMVATWWHVFFRVANFGIFIGFLLCMYRRYAKEFIARALEQEKQLYDGLFKEHEVVMRMHDACKEVIVRRQKEQEIMRSMVKRWHDVVAQEQEHRLTERRSLEKALQHKLDRQSELLHAAHLVSAVIPPAVERARQDLIMTFAQEKEGRAFLVRMFNRMEN